MKAFSKKWVAVAAGLALSSASALAGHIPAFSFNAENFNVNPMVVGEAFAPFVAGAINFAYTSEVDQFGGAGAGVGATANFNETGNAQFSAFLDAVGGNALASGDTGLNLGPGPNGYNLYAIFSGGGTTTRASSTLIEGTFTSFDVTFFVDRLRNTTFSTTGADDFGNSRIANPATTLDDTSVLTGNLVVGGFHASPGLVAGDFDVIFQVTGFGASPGFFSTTTDGQRLTQGDFNGVNSFLSPNINFPPASFTDGEIRGSGNTTFQSVPEPTSLALVGIALIGGALARRKAQA